MRITNDRSSDLAISRTQNPLLYFIGSTQKADELFSDISRGRQRSFMNFSALLCAQVYPTRQIMESFCCRSSMTEILNIRLGDSLYLKTMSLNFWSNRARWSVSKLELSSMLPNQYKNRLLCNLV